MTTSQQLKFAGLTVGTFIRARDFEPRPGRDDMFVEGEIVEVLDADDMRRRGRDAYDAYLVRVHADTLHPTTPREFVFVPHETTIDYDTRVEIIDGAAYVHA